MVIRNILEILRKDKGRFPIENQFWKENKSPEIISTETKFSKFSRTRKEWTSFKMKEKSLGKTMLGNETFIKKTGFSLLSCKFGVIKQLERQFTPESILDTLAKDKMSKTKDPLDI